MQNLDIVEIKSFIPSKDFECSKLFYKKIGFEMESEMDGIAYFKKGSYSFLLQDFYEPSHCNNFMMHLLVENAESWHKYIMVIKDSGEFQIEVTELVSQPWGMLEFCLTDPSGVLWRIAQNN